MNKYELIAKVAKYGTIIASVYMIGHFGLSIHFDNNKKPQSIINNNYSV